MKAILKTPKNGVSDDYTGVQEIRAKYAETNSELNKQLMKEFADDSNLKCAFAYDADMSQDIIAATVHNRNDLAKSLMSGKTANLAVKNSENKINRFDRVKLELPNISNEAVTDNSYER